MNRIKVYCDQCGSIINENEENNCVVYKYVKGETLIFCDDDCMNDFIKENTIDAHVDYHGRLTED